MHLEAQIGHELDRLELLLEQFKAVEAEQDALLASAKPTEETSALPAILMSLKGIDPDLPPFYDRKSSIESSPTEASRRLCRDGDLRPGKWNHRTRARHIQSRDPRLRTTMIQLAWLWLRHQPHSALAQWFKERIKRNGGRLRKTTMVSACAQILVAFCKYVNAGVVIEGAVMKVSS